jgi:L-lactate dehydrogenase complex protein LldF
MLKLLARSGTSQKLTVETHLITGPKRDRETDGPEHMHVVIVDAGRSAVLAGPHREVLRCIRCGACLNTCPVYRSIGGHAYGGVYPGPIGKLVTPLLNQLPDGHELPTASSLCGACLHACPVKIDIPRILLDLRAEAIGQPHENRSKSRLLRWAMRGMRSPQRYAFAQRLVRWLLRRRAQDGYVTNGPGALGQWTAAPRDLPAPPKQSFRDLWRKGEVQ